MRIRKFRVIVPVCIAVLVAARIVAGTWSPISAPPTRATVAASAGLAATRDALLDRIKRGEVPSLAVGVSQGRTILWEEALGWADRESSLPATPETLYPVASVSKSITATGALALAGGGSLRLDDLVQPLLGDVRLPATGESTERVSVSSLLAHESGIPHLWHYEYADRPETVVGREKLIRDEAFVAAPPGERFLYSNLGFGVLAEVIEKAGRASFQKVMQRAVFEPLGMRKTTVDSWVGDSGVICGYDSDDRKIPYRYRLAPDGGAGFFSSVDDLLAYGRFHLGIPGKASVPGSAAVTSALGVIPAGKFYFHGWGVVHIPEGTVLISDGEVAGGTAVVVLIPEKQIVVVVLCNQTGGPSTESAVTILTALLPKFAEHFAAAAGAIDTELSVPGTLPSGLYEGTISNGSGSIAVTADFRNSSAPLLTLAKTTFLLQVTGWDRGALTATVEGSLPIGAGTGRTHRLEFTLWRHGDGLRGIAQEDLFEDRPRFGVPHYVTLEVKPVK